ncbi:MAG: cytochrome C oxidase subunit IV family protein [Bdellovibrio sp.]|jgi:cytochrome c oxidase subunit 4
MGHNSNHTSHSQHEEHHIIPFSILRNVCIALLVLTVLTIFTAKFIHLGVLAAPVAFLIAFVKAMLVMAYFMGLKYDSNGNRIIFATGFFFLAVLGFFCVLDIWTRLPVKDIF